MNWVFFLLLVCNGLFFCWQWLERGDVTLDGVTESPENGAANRLRLLSEVDHSELRPRAGALAHTVGAESKSSGIQRIEHASENASSVPSCYSLGPIPNDDERKQIRAWVLAAGGVPRLRLGERRELALYWVYLPPFETRSEAIRVAEAMAHVGIKDIFVIPRGDMAHAVSLGVYAKNVSLERRLRELKAKGYDASVLPRYRVKSAASIEAEFRGSNGFNRQHLAERFPDLDAVSIACEARLSARQGAS